MPLKQMWVKVVSTNSPEVSLFREKAIDAFSKRSYGRPIASMPRSWIYLLVLLVSLTAIAVWFLSTSYYSRKEKAFGWLAPDKGFARISVLQVGTVEGVYFSQGDYVEEGDVIFVVSKDRGLTTGSTTSKELLQHLENEQDEINTQIRLEKKSSRADVNSAKAQAAQIKLEISEIQDQILQQENRVEIQTEIYAKFNDLAQDESASYLELQTQKERLSSQTQSLSAIKQRKLSLERELLRENSMISNRPIESERVVSELQRRLIEIQNRKIELDVRGNQAIKAPVSGTLATMDIQMGSTVFPQKILASVLPENSELFAEIFIPSRAIGFVKAGQQVRIMYAAFPYQRFGAAEGVLKKISRTVLRPEEIPTAIGMQEPAYRALVRLNRQTVSGFGEKLPLRAGMALEVEIILENRSFLQWILEPIRAKGTS